MGQNVVIQGKLDTDRTKVQEVYVNSAGQLATVPSAGALSQFNRLAGGGICNYTNCTADTLVKSGAGLVYGVIVTAALSAATIDIRDSTTAGGGTILFSIPASTAAGTIINFGGAGVTVNSGIFADFNGTGTINVLYV
jgi:hypothetical protein